MKSFKRGEKGFTLIELLIVVAILGVLAAVVIPNVVGLMGRGGKQAYSTDSKTIQLAAATFYSDVHAYFGNGTWCLLGAEDDTAHLYPTAIGVVNNHVLFLSATDADPDNPDNFVILEAAVDGADDADMTAHAIWMGLLVNEAGKSPADADGESNPGLASAQTGEDALYLNEIPKSASTDNGAASTKAGAYTWIVGKNGAVFGAYKLTGVDPTGALGSGDYWFSGFSGSYP